MATKPTAPKSSEPQTFETAMERLEHIVEQMESENLPLEDLLKRYEEGIQLVKVCEEKLKSAEQRIEIITRNAAGEAQLAEFEPEKKAATAPREDVSLF
jgi:exodeoxyribonuclease VII small subunit